MPVEECGGAFPREFGAVGMEASAFVAVEAMAGARIDINLTIRPLLFDVFDVAHRNALIGFAEMHLRGAARFFTGKGRDTSAVITDRRAQAVQARRRQKRNASTHAEADNPDRSDRLHFG